MKKLRLNLDELVVATFETAAAERETGTVIAHGPKPKPSDPGTCWGYTCPADCAPSFEWTCGETCTCPIVTGEESCWDTCNCPLQPLTAEETCV